MHEHRTNAGFSMRACSCNSERNDGVLRTERSKRDCTTMPSRITLWTTWTTKANSRFLSMDLIHSAECLCALNYPNFTYFTTNSQLLISSIYSFSLQQFYREVPLAWDKSVWLELPPVSICAWMPAEIYMDRYVFCSATHSWFDFFIECNVHMVLNPRLKIQVDCSTPHGIAFINSFLFQNMINLDFDESIPTKANAQSIHPNKKQKNFRRASGTTNASWISLNLNELFSSSFHCFGHKYPESVTIGLFCAVKCHTFSNQRQRCQTKSTKKNEKCSCDMNDRENDFAIILFEWIISVRTAVPLPLFNQAGFQTSPDNCVDFGLELIFRYNQQRYRQNVYIFVARKAVKFTFVYYLRDIFGQRSRRSHSQLIVPFQLFQQRGNVHISDIHFVGGILKFPRWKSLTEQCHFDYQKSMYLWRLCQHVVLNVEWANQTEIFFHQFRNGADLRIIDGTRQHFDQKTIPHRRNQNARQ